jgi:hypothetical protein
VGTDRNIVLAAIKEVLIMPGETLVDIDHQTELRRLKNQEATLEALWGELDAVKAAAKDTQLLADTYKAKWKASRKKLRKISRCLQMALRGE